MDYPPLILCVVLCVIYNPWCRVLLKLCMFNRPHTTCHDIVKGGMEGSMRRGGETDGGVLGVFMWSSLVCHMHGTNTIEKLPLPVWCAVLSNQTGDVVHHK